jgi:hypothetical protein
MLYFDFQLHYIHQSLIQFVQNTGSCVGIRNLLMPFLRSGIHNNYITYDNVQLSFQFDVQIKEISINLSAYHKFQSIKLIIKKVSHFKAVNE